MRIVYGILSDTTRSELFRSEFSHPNLDFSASTLYVVDSSQKRRKIVAALAKKSNGFLPTVIPFDRFIQTLYRHMHGNRLCLSTNASRLLVYHALTTVISEPSNTKLRYSKGLFQEVFRYIFEFEKHGINSDLLKAIPDATEGYGQFFYEVFRKYENLLHANGWHDRFTVANEVSQNIAELPLHIIFQHDGRWKRCFFDGFLDFTPPQLDVIKEISRRCEVTILWPGNPKDNSVFSYPYTKLLYAFPHANWTPNHCVEASQFEKISDYVFAPVDPPRSIHPNLQYICANNIRLEVAFIARDIKQKILESNHTKSPLLPRDFCIVIPDLETYLSLLIRTMERYGIPIAKKLTLPFTSTPLFHLIENLLSAPQNYSRKILLNILSNPLIDQNLFGSEKSLYHLALKWTARLRILRGKNLWLQKLSDQCSKLLKNASEFKECQILYNGIKQLFELIETLNTSKYLRDHLEHLVRVLFELGLHKTSKNDQPMPFVTKHSPFSESNCTHNLFEIFQTELEEIVPVVSFTGYDKVMTLDEFHHLLILMFRHVTCHMDSWDDSCVQIVFRHELHGLSFKHLYFIGFTESNYPPVKHKPVFWTNELLTSLLEKPPIIEEAKSELARMITAALETLSISRPLYDGDETILPSILLKDLAKIFPEVLKPKRITNIYALADIRVFSKQEYLLNFTRHNSLPDFVNASTTPSLIKLYQNTAAILDRINRKNIYSGVLESKFASDRLRLQYGESNGISVTALETYQQCPRLFFFRYVLCLQKKLEPIDDMQPAEIGDYIHSILHEFYKNRLHTGKGKVTKAEFSDALSELKELSIRLHRLNEQDSIFMHREKNLFDRIELLGYPGLAACFLERETETEPCLQPRFLEWSFGMHHDHQP
ncbi:PD-(D/E)XK nuclease family protein, partial [bacterium]|nr:PD-(D/E)XK nuclease family protein [candidate division CSSED10-310 bacterium]